MQRRDFLKNISFATFLGGTLNACSFYPIINNLDSRKSAINFTKNAKNRGFNILGITYQAKDYACKKVQTRQACKGTDGQLIIFDQLGNFTTLPIDITAHSFVQHPIKKNLLWIISNLEHKSYLLDKNTFEFVEQISFDGFYFYGHGIILSDETCITTMAPINDFNKATVVNFDLKTKKILKALNEKNISQHQIIYHSGRNSLISSGRNLSSASVFEIDIDTLSIKSEFKHENSYDFNHLALLNNGEIFVVGPAPVSAPYPYNISPIGTLNIEKKEFKMNSISENEAIEYSGEILNFIFNDSQTKALAINPIKNILYEYNILTNKVENKFKIPIKAMINLNNNYIATTSTFKKTDLYISKSPTEFSEITSIMNTPSGFGSHIDYFQI